MAEADENAAVDAPDAGAVATAPAAGDEGRARVPRAEAGERKRLPYLPALDGIRGIGVIVVVMWHAHVSWLTDGALFVLETFFVLSGFLITSLFMVERHNTGRISLKRFWHRRARRLLPAFVPMFVIVTLYAAWVAKPTELNQIRGDGITSAMYVSNWWFIFSGQSYFEGFGQPSPFRHTWSLSVEEQFYLLIAVVVFLSFRKWGAYRKAYMWIAFAGAAASALWMAILARFGQLVTDGYAPLGIDPDSLPSWAQTFFNFQATGDFSRLYYGTDTRLQGSLVGVATAFFVARIDLHKIKPRTYEILAVIGIGGQIFGWLAIQGEGLAWLYYGGFFVWDLIVACSILAMLSPHGTRIGTWISWKPIVWLGGLSYSIYVLHWPIFVWIDAWFRTELDFFWLTTLKMAVMLGVSYLSFRFFENPIRFKGLPTRNKKIAMAVGVVVLAIAFLTASTVGSQSGDQQAEVTVDSQGRIPLMVAGDSMASVMWTHLNGRADFASGYAMWPSSQLGCGLTAGDTYINGRPTPRKEECAEWENIWTENVTKIDPALSIVVAWGWDLYDRRYTDENGNFVDIKVGTPEWHEIESQSIQRAIDILSSQGGKVLVMNLPCIAAIDNQTAASPQSGSQQVMVDGSRYAIVADRIDPAAILAAEHVPDWLA